MPSFPEVDEQLAYLRKGVAEIIRESDLRERLEQSRRHRQAHCASRPASTPPRPICTWATPCSSAR